MGKFDLFNLGTIGVDLTKSPIHKDDGSLVSAQNAIPDVRGEAGGIAKRDGLVAINSSAASGSITGAGYVDLTAISTRRFYIAIDQDATTSYQWVTSEDAFATTATTTSPAQVYDGGPYSQIDGDVSYMGRLASTGSALIYPGDHALDATSFIPLRKWDGTTDREIVRVPRSPFSPGEPYYVYDMLADGDNVYFIVHDSDNASNLRGRVMVLRLSTGELEQIGNRFGSDTGDVATGGDVIPLSLALHNGYLFCGTGQGTMNVGPTGAGKVYHIRTETDSGWTLDGTFAEQESVMSMASFQGLLYAGVKINANGGGIRLMVRSATGTWSASNTIAHTGSSVAGSMWMPLITHSDKLYAGVFLNEGASSVSRVYDFDGTTWTNVHTVETAATPYRPYTAVSHNGNLYFLSIRGDGLGVGQISKWNGSTWSTVTSNLTTGTLSRFGILTI